MKYIKATFLVLGILGLIASAPVPVEALQGSIVLTMVSGIFLGIYVVLGERK